MTFSVEARGRLMRWGRGYVPTASRDPVFLYNDVLVAIVPERNLNNGQRRSMRA